MSMPRRLLALVWAALALASPATAQPAPGSRTYGTKSESFVRVTPAEVTTYTPSVPFQNVGTSLSSSLDGAVFFGAVRVPPGAVLTSYELDACDTAMDTLVVTSQLRQCDHFGDNCTVASDLAVSDNLGCQQIFDDLTLLPSPVVADSQHELVFQVTLQSSFTSFRGVVVGYKLQVSPAPATATFGDVPTDYIYFRAIEALAASGIASGCGSGNYCPDQPVTRGELAKFLANGLGLHWQ